MLVSAAFVPATPLVVPEVAAGAAGELAALRAASINAVAEVLRRGADRVVMIAPGRSTGAHSGAVSFAGLGVAPEAARPAQSELPVALSVGQWLVEQVMGRADEHLTIAHDATAAECQDLGAQLAGSASRVAAIVVGDGSACRSDKAPGSFDERAAAFDQSASDALASVDTDALLALDVDLAAALQVAGRAPWQVAAAMAQANDLDLVGALHHRDDPYGVAYFVATWSRG